MRMTKISRCLYEKLLDLFKNNSTLEWDPLGLEQAEFVTGHKWAVLYGAQKLDEKHELEAI